MQVISSLLIVFVLEAILLFFMWLIDEKCDKSRKKKVLYFALALIVLSIAGYMFYPSLMVLYKTKLVSAIISVIIFGIVSIFFDLPTWRVDKTNYELTDRGKIYKFYSQTSVIATATGIAWWQNVPIQIIESSKPCAIELLIGLVVIIALSLEFIMGITLFLFNKGWLNTIYKKKESK